MRCDGLGCWRSSAVRRGEGRRSGVMRGLSVGGVGWPTRPGGLSNVGGMSRGLLSMPAEGLRIEPNGLPDRLDLELPPTGESVKLAHSERTPAVDANASSLLETSSAARRKMLWTRGECTDELAEPRRRVSMRSLLSS